VSWETLVGALLVKGKKKQVILFCKEEEKTDHA
jgi:hypothetical protein